jgi:hypothetical protein
LLIWTNEPWDYLNFRRVSATRFIWKSFLMGEIYLGPTSPEFVLDGSWDQYQEDLNESNPTAFLEYLTNPVPADTPAAEVLRSQFTEAVRTDRARLLVRNDLFSSWSGALRDETPLTPQRRVDGGWTVASGTARYALGALASTQDLLQIPYQPCSIVEATVDPSSTTALPPSFVLRMAGFTSAGRPYDSRLSVEGPTATSGDAGAAFLQQVSGAQPGEPTTFRLIVGRKSIGLFMNGLLRAVVSLPVGVTTIDLEPREPEVNITNLHIGADPDCLSREVSGR